MLVWRLDRWGRSLIDLVVTLKELADWCRFRVAHPSAGSTTPTGRAMVGLLSVFAAFEHDILREPRGVWVKGAISRNEFYVR